MGGRSLLSQPKLLLSLRHLLGRKNRKHSASNSYSHITESSDQAVDAMSSAFRKENEERTRLPLQMGKQTVQFLRARMHKLLLCEFNLAWSRAASRAFFTSASSKNKCLVLHTNGISLPLQMLDPLHQFVLMLCKVETLGKRSLTSSFEKECGHR